MRDREGCIAFNDRDLTRRWLRSRDVDWLNGTEAASPRSATRPRSSERQWSILDPRVTPVAIAVDPDGRVNVLVHQEVHDKNGQLVVDHHVRHVYELTGDLVQHMEIRPA